MNSLKHLNDEELHASALKSAQTDMQSQLSTVMHLLEVNRQDVVRSKGIF